MAKEQMFADHIARTAGVFEPQRQHQFSIEIELDDTTKKLIELAVSTAALPVLTSDEIAIPYLNSIVYVAGKNTPQDSSITIVDYLDEDSQQRIYNWRKQVYNPDNGFVGPAALYKKSANLILLSPDGTKERKWELRGVWPKSVAFGSLDMSTSEVVKIEMTLRYDVAKYIGV